LPGCIYSRIIDECASAGILGRALGICENEDSIFEFAAQIFEGPTLEQLDTRLDYGEHRAIALGQVLGIVLTVVYTDRAESTGGVSRRIISARKSNHRERDAYKTAAIAQ
jgi:hypothetical protein